MGHVAQMGEKRDAYRLLVGKPEVERQLGISLSLSLFLSVFCAACQCFETLFSVLNTCHFLKSLK
jgi:hypothetical protein